LATPNGNSNSNNGAATGQLWRTDDELSSAHCHFEGIKMSKAQGFPHPSRPQKLMFLRCFRVDRIFRSINQYIVETMDEFYIMPPVVSFTAIFEQTSSTIPVCFVLSAGSDPTNDLIKLADSIVGMSNFCHISLGQGQEKAALRLLDGAIKQGMWLMLQNGHLLMWSQVRHAGRQGG